MQIGFTVDPWPDFKKIDATQKQSKCHLMKLKKLPPEKNLGNAALEAETPLNESLSDISNSRDELARRAYFSYLNQGSQPGHEVQQWLDAEAALRAERALTRTHGFEHQPN